MKSAVVFFSSLMLFISSCSAETQQEQRLGSDQIINIMMTVDKGEIDEAKEALKKKLSPTVDAFAKYLIQRHQNNLDELTQLAKQLGLQPKDSTISNSLEADGKIDLEKFSELQGDALDKAYIDTSVKEHRDGLQLIDSKLIPETQNSQLKAALEKFRQMVADHLEKGLQIQKNLNP